MSLNLTDFKQAEYGDGAESVLPVAVAEPMQVQPEAADGAYPLALAFGLAGALLGAIAYAVFVTATGLQIGYLSIGVAYLVARGIVMGSRGRGGPIYQWTAVALTLISVAAGNALMLWWEIHKQQSVALSLHNLGIFLRYGFEQPFLEFRDSGVSAALGLFILFIGLRAAWRMTSGVPGAVAHPFSR